MTDGQYLWVCIGVAAAAFVTGWALVRSLRGRWERRHARELQWRRLADRDGPLPRPGRWGRDW